MENRNELKVKINAKKLLKGKDIKKYVINWSGYYVIYPYDKNSRALSEATLKYEYPNAFKYLKDCKNVLKGRDYFDNSPKKWFELWNQRSFENFQLNRIITPEITDRNNFVLTNSFYGNTKTYHIIPKDKSPDHYLFLLGLLNSTLLDFIYKKITTPQAGGFYAYKTQFLSKLPIRAVKQHKPYSEIVSKILKVSSPIPITIILRFCMSLFFLDCFIKIFLRNFFIRVIVCKCMEKLYFITGNKGKFKEAKIMLRPLNIKLIQTDIGYPEIQASDLKEIVLFSINFCNERLKSPFFLEDSGLFIDELNSFPGPYSRYIQDTIGNDGILKLLLNVNNRSAYFKSIVGLYKNGPHIFEGISRGIISNEILGHGGFGYDPIFIPEKSPKSFGEMTTIEKNKFSHRGRALEKLVTYLESGVE